VAEGDLELLTVSGGERRWVALGEATGMALTGLARKVLTRAGLLGIAESEKIPQQHWQEVV
jgi:hypothetical protein